MVRSRIGWIERMNLSGFVDGDHDAATHCLVGQDFDIKATL